MSRQGSELRQKRRAKGLCCQCGAEAFGKSRCPACLAKCAESRRRYVSRMTADERERMYSKEIARQRMARELEVKLNHMKYIEDVKRYSKVDVPKVEVKLTGLAKAFLEEG